MGLSFTSKNNWLRFAAPVVKSVRKHYFGSFPVPVNGNSCGLPEALSVMVMSQQEPVKNGAGPSGIKHSLIQSLGGG
jgi:hypothetical protein